jgi:endonuclease YncB( thermonuclease family)
MPHPIPTLLLITFLFVPPIDLATDLVGKVVGVSDGDTITVLVDKKPIKIRLEGIDAPEAKQSFGNRSKQALSDLVFGKEVRVKKTGEDRYGRSLGLVSTDGIDINAKMIQDGWAWHYKKYNRDSKLADLEMQARAAKRGLWTESNPLAPWDFRDRQKPKQAASTGGEHWLNTSSNVRHNQSCEHFKQTKKGRLCRPDEGKACGICGG